MTLEDVLRELIQCLDDAGEVVIGWEQARRWPEGAVEVFVKAGWIKPAPPASTVECPGCEDRCFEPVHVIQSQDRIRSRAYVACIYRDDMGRVPIPIAQLDQWQITAGQVARWVSKQLGIKADPKKGKKNRGIELGIVRGTQRSGAVALDFSDSIRLKVADQSFPLVEVVSLEDQQLHLDREALILHLARQPEPCDHNCVSLDGEYWRITYGGQTTSVRNTMGMRYITFLIGRQGKEVLVSDLYYAINPPESGIVDRVYSDMSETRRGEEGLSLGDLGDAGDILTPEGKKRLKAAVRRIQDGIDDAVERGDEEKQAKLEAQQEQILSHIAAGSGLGGKSRKASSAIEKVRTSVTKRIKADIKKITETNPDLGRHLDQAIRTGTSCQYAPHPAVDWHLELPESLS